MSLTSERVDFHITAEIGLCFRKDTFAGPFKYTLKDVRDGGEWPKRTALRVGWVTRKVLEAMHADGSFCWQCERRLQFIFMG